MNIAERLFVAMTRSRRRLSLTVLFTWCVAFLSHGLFVWTATKTLEHGAALLFDSAVSGIVAATLVWIVLVLAVQRRNRILRDLRIVAELNHNVRNALQILLGTSQTTRDAAQAETICDCVGRIEHTLRSLFPVLGERDGDKWWASISETDELPLDRRRPE
jgi:hypothetical protein